VKWAGPEFKFQVSEEIVIKSSDWQWETWLISLFFPKAKRYPTD